MNPTQMHRRVTFSIVVTPRTHSEPELMQFRPNQIQMRIIVIALEAAATPNNEMKMQHKL